MDKKDVMKNIKAYKFDKKRSDVLSYESDALRLEIRYMPYWEYQFFDIKVYVKISNWVNGRKLFSVNRVDVIQNKFTSKKEMLEFLKIVLDRMENMEEHIAKINQNININK